MKPTTALTASLFTLLLSSYSTAECPIEFGYFELESKSEYLLTLALEKDQSLQLLHEYWVPGKGDETEVEIFDGTWSCQDQQVTLNYGKQTDQAEYGQVGKNSLGIEPNQIALKIKSSANLLGNRVLLDIGS